MEMPYEVTPRRDTGLFNAKLGVWLFLASEVMLFGGLFSAYVFLRVGVHDGVDPPWPWGVNVHKTFVVIGFVNTVVLIVSSVFVVFAWVSLKERKYAKFQFFMWATVACAAIFMLLKTVEYRSKLFEHHDVRLQDNSILEGKILDKTYHIPFEVEGGSFNLVASNPGFLGDIKGDFPALTVTWKQLEGEELKEVSEELTTKKQFLDWFVEARTRSSKDLATERKRYRKEISAMEKARYEQEPFETPRPPNVDTKAVFTAKEPFSINARWRKVRPVQSAGGTDSLTYTDGMTLTGKAGDDSILFEPHYVDMQLVPLHKQEKSMVWEVLGDHHLKEAWIKNRDAAYEEMKEHYGEDPVPDKMLRGYYINLQSIHPKEDAKPFWDEFIHEFKAGAGWLKDEGSDHHHDHEGDHSEEHGKSDDAGHGKSHEKDHGDHGHHAVISIPRDKVKFFNSHGPRNNNYYGLYFTITALHGLHVVGGALVLLYFVIFGRRLYRQNPEHLANRVEVGGLFWHFVDLVWIFLFPLMYLL